MLRKLTDAVRGMANDPTVLVLVGMALLTRGLDVIAQQVTEQAAAVREQVAAAVTQQANGQARYFQDPAEKPAYSPTDLDRGIDTDDQAAAEVTE